jgi:hypothetical protein
LNRCPKLQKGSTPTGLVVRAQVGGLSSLRLLNLSHQLGTRRFSGKLPDRITLLNGLTGLHMQHNQFSGALPPQIWRMESLEFLLAQGNNLEGPIPHGIGYLSNLRSLLLNDNSIDGTLPDTLGGMHYLQELDLQQNSMSGTLPPALGLMPRLKTLYAQKNRISGALPSTVGQLQALSHLDLRQNSLQGPLPSSLGLLKALRVLDLSLNSLTHELPSELGQLSALTHLLLNDNYPGLSQAIPNSLGALSSVQQLALRNNSFNGRLPSFLRNGFQASRAVTLDANPFYCPLEEWAILNYSGIHCLHCPGEDPRRPDGSKDYTQTCSGHGVCIDGQACECEAAWSLANDCSQLACPTSAVEGLASGDDESAVQYCNGVGTCYNTVNSSISCPTSAVDTVGTDFVAQHLDCAVGVIVIARCQCPAGGFIKPRCLAFTASEAGNVLVFSDATRTLPGRMSWLLALVSALMILRSWHCH